MNQIFKLARDLIFILFISLVSLIFVLLVFRFYGVLMKATIDEEYAPKEWLWVDDDVIGYRNRPNQDKELLGGITTATNSQGFRGIKEYSLENDKVRVIGLGDSVMWGLRLHENDTFIKVAGNLLNDDGVDTEIINTGVIGYSSLQTLLHYKKYGSKYKANYIVANFCINDFLPSEDPFGRKVDIIRSYLRDRLLNKYLEPLKDNEVHIINSLIEGPDFWSQYNLFYNSKGDRPALRKILIEGPLIELNEVAKKLDTSLLLIFLVNDFHTTQDKEDVNQLILLAEKSEIQYLNFMEELREPLEIYNQGTAPQFEDTTIGTILSTTKISDLLHLLNLDALDPTPIARNLSKLNSYNQIDTKRNLLDWIHPSKLGASKIGKRIYQHIKNDLKTNPRNRQLK